MQIKQREMQQNEIHRDGIRQNKIPAFQFIFASPTTLHRCHKVVHTYSRAVVKSGQLDLFYMFSEVLGHQKLPCFATYRHRSVHSLMMMCSVFSKSSLELGKCRGKCKGIYNTLFELKFFIYCKSCHISIPTNSVVLLS